MNGSTLRRRSAALLLLIFAGAVQAGSPLRICADSADLPFSDSTGRGFENVLAQMLAEDLGRTLDFVWRFQHGLFAPDSQVQAECEVVLAVPAGSDPAVTTSPYYRSSYVFVTRKDRGIRVRSFADARLRSLRIGVLARDGDTRFTPPGRLAAAYGLAGQLRGYRYSVRWGRANPGKALIDAVEAGEVDIAAGWGPVMGYFAARSRTALDLVAVDEDPAHPEIAMRYAIAIAVPSSDGDLRAKLDAFLAKRRDAIRQLLVDYHVPLEASPPRAPRKSTPDT